MTNVNQFLFQFVDGWNEVLGGYTMGEVVFVSSSKLSNTFDEFQGLECGTTKTTNHIMENVF